MRFLINNPKFHLILILTIVFLASMSHLPLEKALYLLALCVGGTIITDLLFTFLRRRSFFIPYSAVITGLILTLIIDTTATWDQILLIVTASMFMKNFFRITQRHIFNPAASGLFVGWAVFGLNPSWWAPSPFTVGFSLQNLLVLLAIVAISFVSCYRFRRYYTVLSFLALSSIFAAASSSSPVNAAISAIVSPGALFYALLMLPEPQTSPISRNRQLLYGAFVAVVSTLLVFGVSKGVFSFLPTPVDTSIVSLLLGNLLFFKFR